ncbi:hypothetical protein GGQ74_001061 [Desulfobaculum xiamenense]|uniref:AMIN domain-containing protein n=1 Tax=Desulfobaculum xiamenense TaxID=995050 RepID=A0A846QGR2_9BACT|nr:AMIN domain-containing protein [Desulfobaculum xiamenense]NJB67421.1 hypothetical protein [Desulfobaculum xiamenense]
MRDAIRNTFVLIAPLALVALALWRMPLTASETPCWEVRRPVSHDVLAPDSTLAPGKAPAQVAIPAQLPAPAAQAESGKATDEAPAPAPTQGQTLTTVKASPATAPTVTGVHYAAAEDVLDVTIRTDGGIPRFTAFPLDSPPRIVVDVFAQSALPDAQQELLVDCARANRIRTGFHPARGVVRTVIETTAEGLAHFDVRATDDAVHVLIGHK